MLLKTFNSTLIRLFFMVMTLCTSLLNFAIADEKSSELQMIEMAVYKYFDGTSNGTPNLLKEVFLPTAKLESVRNGEFSSWPSKQYISGFEEGVKYDRTSRIINVDYTNNAASVKAEIKMNNSIYIDYLLLLKVDGEWKISNKTFTVAK